MNSARTESNSDTEVSIGSVTRHEISIAKIHYVSGEFVYFEDLSEVIQQPFSDAVSSSSSSVRGQKDMASQTYIRFAKLLKEAASECKRTRKQLILQYSNRLLTWLRKDPARSELVDVIVVYVSAKSRASDEYYKTYRRLDRLASSPMLAVRC